MLASSAIVSSRCKTRVCVVPQRATGMRCMRDTMRLLNMVSSVSTLEGGGGAGADFVTAETLS